ncbi:MAG: flagellar biosynthesis protein FlgD [Deltaproteobacteria bacterium]|nr:flagellar biosynthesis protein FlgD [Deltaproteobacteria bacterium]
MIEGLGVYGSATGNTAKTKSAEDAMGKDAFLKLLVTQLENQDPLNPTDNTEFVAQLAQFSSLEGIQNLNTSLGDMKGSMNALQEFGSTSLIGKNAKAEGSSFVYGGSPRKLGFSLGSDASSATLIIKEPSGKAVKEIELGQLKAGYNEAEWNGANNAGAQANQGLYSFSVEARGTDGKAIDSRTFVKGPVTGVSLSGNKALYIDGLEISRDLVTEIY